MCKDIVYKDFGRGRSFIYGIKDIDKIILNSTYDRIKYSLDIKDMITLKYNNIEVILPLESNIIIA